MAMCRRLDTVRPSGLGGRMQAPPITREDIERFRRGAQRCRTAAELEWEPRRQQDQLNTALAYERMATRAERLLGLTEQV
jgi:hypothetical protein